ncbi:uncharacterized protein RAG0_13112 [Rhynchosporium agropyri]|uniref:Uncharacterized protein n=1 Tax=Rhynchosporium agropyri TaxID=914238 RepID=A0A1E1LBD0_9HELO|nr:uncharacterized protein RAG0_13112 [Rhynchosporium agropyri]
MGRNRRGTNGRNFDHLIWEDRKAPRECPTAQGPRSSPGRPSCQPLQGPRNNYERFNNPPERRQNHPKQPWDVNQRNAPGRSTNLSTPHCVDQGFITKSRWLKAYLTRSFSAALSQIEQWYPDDGGDEMDWQPDSTTVFKQLPGPTCICGELSRSAGNSLPRTAGEDVLQAQCLLEETQSGGFDGGSPAADCRNESFSMKRSSGFSDTVGTVSDDVQRRDVSL